MKNRSDKNATTNNCNDGMGKSPPDSSLLVSSTLLFECDQSVSPPLSQLNITPNNLEPKQIVVRKRVRRRRMRLENDMKEEVNSDHGKYDVMHKPPSTTKCGHYLPQESSRFDNEVCYHTHFAMLELSNELKRLKDQQSAKNQD